LTADIAVNAGHTHRNRTRPAFPRANTQLDMPQLT